MALLAVLAVASGAWMAVRLRGPAYLSHSERLFDTGSWYVRDVRWRSASTLLGSAYGTRGGGLSGSVLFVGTKGSRRASELRELESAEHGRRHWWEGFSFRPPGDRVAVCMSGSASPPDVLNVDTQRLVASGPPIGRDSYLISNCVWLSDEKTIAYLSDQVVRPVARRFWAHTWDTDTDAARRFGPLAVPDGVRGSDFDSAVILGQTRHGSILVAAGFDLMSGRHGSIRLFEMSTDAARPNRAQYVLGFGQGARILDVALSPSGDRLAWLVVIRERPDPVVRWLGRWLSMFRFPPREVAQMRMSGLHGERMRSVERVGEPGRWRGSPFSEWLRSERDLPRVLRWLPDGKHLSFVYRGGIWLCTAP